jgi:hypothetical protein
LHDWHRMGTLIGVTISVIAVTVALLNLRLSRFPHVRVRMKVFQESFVRIDLRTTKLPYTAPKGNVIFEVEVISLGLPIYEMTVTLEAWWQEFNVPMQGDEKRHQGGRLILKLAPVGTVSQPMNAGQSAKFRARQPREGEVERFVSDNVFFWKAPNRVSVCVYGSGERLVKRVRGWRFPRGFSALDALFAPECEQNADFTIPLKPMFRDTSDESGEYRRRMNEPERRWSIPLEVQHQWKRFQQRLKLNEMKRPRRRS